MDDPSWAHYASTTIEFLADHSLVVPLTKPVPVEAARLLAMQSVGPTFAVLTACNPHGRETDEAQNRRLTELLRAELVKYGRAWVPADGVSPDGSHREPGFAVALSKADAHDLACRFGQSAFFWFDGASMWLIGAAVVVPDQRLPL